MTRTTPELESHAIGCSRENVWTTSELPLSVTNICVSTTIFITMDITLTERVNGGCL